MCLKKIGWVGGGGGLIEDLRCVYDGAAELVTLVPVCTSVLYTAINLQYVYDSTSTSYIRDIKRNGNFY